MVDHEEIKNDDFEEMLNKSLTNIDNFKTGQQLEGEVVYIDRENVFLDISGKSEAIIAVTEFTDKDGRISVKEGEKVTAFVVSTGGGEIELTTAIGKSRINIRLLEIAYAKSIPVHGTVKKLIKGGFSVSVSDLRCFCPLSQIDKKTPHQPEEYINRSFDFKIIRLENDGKNIVLSRNAILKEEKNRAINEMRNSVKAGDTVAGKVISIRDFGLFVDIGGIDALVPRSEISWSRFADINSFSEGQEVTAKILSLDWDNEKITLSIKQLQPEPWAHIDKFHTGNNYNGRITNIIKQGAFVELEPGLEGFIHISGMSKIKRVNNPEEVLTIGDTVNIKIINIDPENRKMSLELITGEADPWQLPPDELKNEVHKGIVEISGKSGITVRLTNGMSGFIPRNELSEQNKGDLQKMYPAGREVSVIVKEINIEKKNLILSEKDAANRIINKEYEEYSNKNRPSDSSSLGAQFKDKFLELQEKISRADDD